MRTSASMVAVIGDSSSSSVRRSAGVTRIGSDVTGAAPDRSMGGTRAAGQRNADEMRRLQLLVALWLVCTALLPARMVLAEQLDRVVVRFVAYEGPARIFRQAIERHRLRIDVDPKSETKELLIHVELPRTGRDAWPVADVEVRDARGEPVVVRRSGIEWHKLLKSVPAVKGSYFVQAIDPPLGKLRLTIEKQRQLVGAKSGLRVSLARWYDGHQAALSLRFDDSHVTHLAKVIPMLGEYGFRGTFMINPGPDEPGSRRRSAFQMHLAEWEAVAKSGAHEFANHSAHHRGATGDYDMDAEIGEAARAIWKLTPRRSRLTALNLGGGTQWATSRTLRYYLDAMTAMRSFGIPRCGITAPSSSSNERGLSKMPHDLNSRHALLRQRA